MSLRPFPAESHVRWRRLDVPGTEEARVVRTAGGWRLTGEVRVEEGGPAGDGEGRWSRDAAPLPGVEGALDVDLGFTPATNTLPIRRLALAVGETRPVRSAWLRFPGLRLEPLEQTYTREAGDVYR